ncbi:hypothetical protein KQI68_10155 [Peptoniphilus sp. MSJ-1]|uniref:Uncharacterized protein n=1 Tax=Peptoniphilus ovalis TaxID=2841503 RepID=A0ABS6FJ33_9FIRM|nr:hypothetical protein [Peptoniphilus ovalis]MBU5670192.1 hypothetical protein [Peptoniphilus ovalis]
MDTKKSHRVFSLLLALVMIIGILPINAFANTENMIFTDIEDYHKNSSKDLELKSTSRLKSISESSASPDIATRAVDAEGKPPLAWDDNEGAKDDGSEYWDLPAGVKVIHAQNGSDPLNTIGISYMGRRLDEKGNIILKFDIAQQHTASTGVWSHYVMRFPKELYNAIDWEKSYAASKQVEFAGGSQVEFLKFTDSPIKGQTAYAKSFSFKDGGTSYRHYDVNIVLKSSVNWENDFANKTQVVQMRLYDDSGSRIFSTSRSSKNAVIAKYSYNTHTKTAVIGDKTNKPKDLIESTTISATDTEKDMFWTNYSTLQLDKEEKKVRLTYVVTKSETTNPNYKDYGEDIAFRQTLDPDFVRYLDLGEKDAQIGKVYILDNKESKYGPEVPIYAKDLNGIEKNAQGRIETDEHGNPTYNRDDKSVFIQVATKDFVDKENLKIKSGDPNKIEIKNQDDPTSVFFNNMTKDGYFVVFEYDIDPIKINDQLIKDGEFVKNFMFDTRYITSNNKGVRKFTFKTTKDIKYEGNKNLFYRIRFTPAVSISGSRAALQREQDFVLNIGGSEGIWKSWKREGYYWSNAGTGNWDYGIPVYGFSAPAANNVTLPGGTIPAGTEVNLYLPNYSNKFNADNVKVDLATGDNRGDGLAVPSWKNVKPIEGTEIELQKVKEKNGNEVFHFPYYIKNTVSRVGGSAIREQHVPIVDEVFTDSESITGIMKSAAGVKAQVDVPEGNNFKRYHSNNWIDTKQDNDGNIEKYLRSDGKGPEEEIEPDKITETRRFDKTNYEGFKFQIKNQYAGGDSLKESNEEKTLKELGLIKDQPILLNTFTNTSLNSETIFEQVQAKVKFNLYPEQNISMERIVPLNKQYSVVPPKVAKPGDVEKFDLNEGKLNPTYKPNGFLPKPGEDNIRIDEKTPTIAVQRESLTETDGFNKIKTKTYPNFINHDGFTYDINNSDNTLRDEATQNFLKRLFPDAEFDSALSKKANGQPREDNKVVIGWTKVELKDTPTLSAEDQFYKLEKDKKVLTETKQWDDNENYIFNEYSPVDKNRQVYAVWGVPSLVLHANNTTEDKETIVRIPYTEADVTNTNKIIDAMTSATKDNLKNNNVIKALPLAPYRYDSKQLGETYDERLESFVMESSTFVGWTLERYPNDETSRFVAGNNNDRIGEIKKGMTKDNKSLPKRTESTQYMDGKRDAYVPNGFNFAVSKGFEALMKEGKDIHLYANYRPYFDVKVLPRYRNVSDPVTGYQYGKYEDNVDAAKKKPLNVALLYRTAVTDYTTPTVLQGATYNPLTTQDAIKLFDGTSTSPLTWTVPGYDREGLRQSYVAVVVPEGKKEAYKNFKQAQDPQNPDAGINDWNSLGISTYVKVSGNSAELDKNAPRNLHETVVRGDPYGVGLAKQQTFTIKEGSKVDAYTSATSRQSVLRGDREVKGYNIFLTNTPKTIQAPVFDNVKGTDTSFSVNFDQDLIDQKLSGLKLKVPYAVEDGEPGKYKAEYRDINLTIGEDGKTITAPDGITATVENGKLKVGNFDFTNLPAGEENRTIYGNFTKAVEGGEDIVSDQGKVVITQLLVSNPVTDMEQTPKKDGENARIKFVVPEPDPTDQVVVGTTYTAQKFDKDQNKWIDVGTLEITKPKMGNSTQEIPLTGDVAHEDTIRIVSKEPGKKPGYSVGDETNTPYTPMQPNPDKPNDPVSDYKHYVKLDLEGPKIEGKAEDETFRRYINIKATLDEMPGDKITIELGTKGQQGTEGNKTVEATKATAVEKFNEIVRENENTLHGIWIIAVDEMGNKTTKEVDYIQTYQLKVTATGARPNRDFFRLKSEKDNTSVRLTVREGNNIVLEQTLTLKDANKYEKITFMKDGQSYKLKSGQELEIKGSCVEDSKIYTTNPFKLLIH